MLGALHPKSSMEYLFIDALDELIRAERYDISILRNRKVYHEAAFPIISLSTALYNHQIVIEMLFRHGYPDIPVTTDIPNDGELQDSRALSGQC